jgi:hypothetical protein
MESHHFIRLISHVTIVQHVFTGLKLRLLCFGAQPKSGFDHVEIFDDTISIVYCMKPGEWAQY